MQLATRPLTGPLLAVVAALALGTTWWYWGDPASSPTGPLQCALPPVPESGANPAHVGMVWVPSGLLPLGDTIYPEEQPIQNRQVAGFWMDKSEVTNAQFARFVKATGYVTEAERPVDAARHPNLPPEMRLPGAVVFVLPTTEALRDGQAPGWRYLPGANWQHPGGPGTHIQGRYAFPVVAVTVADAKVYAAWLGHQLPTEAQWEWAARGGETTPPGNTTQPQEANTWQGLFPVVNSADDGFAGLAPIGCYKPNGYGLFDMIGNVWELTSDAWGPHQSTEQTSTDLAPPAFNRPPGAASNPTQRVIKGGSYLCAPSYCMRYRAGARQPQDDDLAAGHLGFRTVLMAPGPVVK